MAIPVLADHIGDGLAREAAILDGEIVCLDERGHPRFNGLHPGYQIRHRFMRS